MEETSNPREQSIGFPFYIFISILLGTFAVISIRQALNSGTPGTALLMAALFLTHIGLYWVNLKQFTRLRWWMFYYLAQTLLIVSLSLLPNGISFIGSAIIAIIGEGLGIWGNTRRSLSLGVFYTMILIVSLVVHLESEALFTHLSQILINGGFIVLIMIVFNQQLEERRKAEELAETLESANAKLAAYAARNETLTLQAERERMARELHDTLAQGVAGLILQLEALKAHQQQENYPQAQAVLEQAIARARSTLSESRAAIEDLRNDDKDFKSTVMALVSQFKSTSDVTPQLTLKLDEARPIPANVQHHARRVLHEALSNLGKHAEATQAQIEIEQHEDTLVLLITDNGKGFDPDQPLPQGHFGLQGLEERARLTRSHYTLSSAPGAGTSIEFIFPLTEGIS